MRLADVDNPTPPKGDGATRISRTVRGHTIMAIKEQCLVHTTFGDIDATMERGTAVAILKADDRELVSIEDADGINLHTMKAMTVQGITFPATKAVKLAS